MTISIDLTPQEITALRQIIQVDDDATAVSTAAREFLRVRRLSELKAASGKVSYESRWEQLEELELGESSPPA